MNNTMIEYNEGSYTYYVYLQIRKISEAINSEAMGDQCVSS